MNGIWPERLSRIFLQLVPLESGITYTALTSKTNGFTMIATYPLHSLTKKGIEKLYTLASDFHFGTEEKISRVNLNTLCQYGLVQPCDKEGYWVGTDLLKIFLHSYGAPNESLVSEALCLLNEKPLDDVFAEIKLLLDWQPGFSLFFVFSDGDGRSKQLHENIRSHYGKIVDLPSSNDDLGSAITLIDEVVNSGNKYNQDNIPLWINLAFGSKQQDSVRNDILVMLNQRRSLLESSSFSKPLFIELPFSYVIDIVNYAPDLFSVKTHSSYFKQS